MASWACAGDDGTTTTGDDDDVFGGADDDDVFGDDDDDLPPSDSGQPDSPYIDPYWFTIQAHFGFDPEAGVVNAFGPMGELQSAIYVLLGAYEWEADSFSDRSEHYCVIVLPLVQAGPAPPFVFVNGLWHGVRYDPVLSPPLSTCTGRLDPDVWGPAPEFLFADVFYGVGVGPHALTYLDYIFDPDIVPYIAGGYVSNDFLYTSSGQHEYAYYAYATEIDENHYLRIDAKNEPILILEEDIPRLGAPAPLARARYSMFSYYYYY